MKSFIVEAPSNIALLKYWGKENVESQIPANDSLSITLKKSKTVTKIFKNQNQNEPDSFILNDQKVFPENEPKIFNHIQRIKIQLNWSEGVSITSDNTFPTASGIASSASGFSALTTALVALATDSQSLEELAMKGWGREKLANLSRLGSGSSCRSFWPGFVLWEKNQVGEIFSSSYFPLGDSIVCVNQNKKEISSSQGHLLAATSPLYLIRQKLMNEKKIRMKKIINERDMFALGHLIEEEALSMHSVMMTSNPPIQYIQKETEEVIQKIISWRQKENIPVFFTLDAGPNVHLIYPKEYLQKVMDLCQNEMGNFLVIHDEIGGEIQLTCREEM